MATGVYEFQNRYNGKRYVGSAARSLKTRKADHIRLLSKGSHPNTHFQRAWAEYGADAFEYRVLEYCLSDQCLDREQFWIDKFRAADPEYGYNICEKAGSVLGRRWERDKASYNWMKNEEWREKIRQSSTGRKHSDATKAKISAGNKGKRAGIKLTEEHKAKINWTGKNHTPETRAKMSAAHKGKLPSSESRRKMSKAARLRWFAAKLKALS